MAFVKQFGSLYIGRMIEQRWTIDISKTFIEIEQQVIAIVEEMDDLGAFNVIPSHDADNDN
ncbi:hypothetical protein NHF48_001165 [Sphingomonas sp. H160509]|uniref:hypothetical protein n=1 Tax=Sphingomonas sp. H160509 TaxID=2955313 RepID=UPI002098020B|nr:hypothetical protein [Sphingomonas sp. H160509]MDD1449861.1 hypothetical protein [Sphingomonas sp. H160509]